MTRAYNNKAVIKCPHCGKLVKKPEAPFNAWVREHPLLGSKSYQAALSICDIDLAVHQYEVTDKANGRVIARQHLLFIEVKTFDAEPPFWEHDTLNVIHQHGKASKRPLVHAKRGRKKLFFHGVHLVQFDGTDPSNSNSIQWDRRPIDVDTLVDILRFRIDANTLHPREDRLHHVAQPALDETWMQP